MQPPCMDDQSNTCLIAARGQISNSNLAHSVHLHFDGSQCLDKTVLTSHFIANAHNGKHFHGLHTNLTSTILFVKWCHPILSQILAVLNTWPTSSNTNWRSESLWIQCIPYPMPEFWVWNILITGTIFLLLFQVVWELKKIHKQRSSWTRMKWSLECTEHMPKDHRKIQMLCPANLKNVAYRH